MPNGYIMGDNGIPIELADVTVRDGVAGLLRHLEAMGIYVIPIAEAGPSVVDQYLVHEYTIVDGKIMDTITGEDMSESKFVEIDTTGQYIKVINTSNAFAAFDAISEYTVEIIATDEYLEEKSGDKVFGSILYSSQSWTASRFGVGHRYGYRQYGYIDSRLHQYPTTIMRDCTSGRYLNCYSDRACTNEVYAAISVSQQDATLRYNVQGKSVDYSDKLDTTKEFLNCNMVAFMGTDQYFKRIRIYAKALTDEELVIAFLNSGTRMYGKTADGITPNGPAVVYSRLPDGTPVMLDRRMESAGTFVDNESSGEYTIHEFEYPEVDYDTSAYTHCSIYTRISEMRVGDMMAVNALPHPFSAKTPYLIKWASSDPGVIECVDGLLTAKTTGTATITATIANSEISDSITISIVEGPIVATNYYYPTVEEYAFSDSDPAVVMAEIQRALSTALDGEYNGIVFPTMDYYITPVITNETYKRCILLMKDNFVIDFSGSNWYMQDNEYSHCEADAVDHSDGYTLFEIKFCEGLTLRNLNYYGERSYMEQVGREENQYTEFVKFAVFGLDAVRCKLENINFHNTVGFNIGTDTALFTSSYANGQVHHGDFAAGRIDDNGDVVDDPGCICTPGYIKINPIGDAIPARYRFGFLAYTSYHEITSRLYDCFLYDADHNLIRADMLNHQYDLYDMPDGAAYFRVNFYQSNLPTVDTADQLGNSYSISMMGYRAPDLCRITNCRFYNPHASAWSITGGQRFIADHNYTENGKRYAWSVDYEDGWMEMRNNVIYKNICLGKWMMVMGAGNKFQNNFLASLNLNRFNENTSVINNHIRTWNQCERYTGVDAYNVVVNVVDTEANNGTGWINQWTTWGRDTSEEYGYTAY